VTPSFDAEVRMRLGLRGELDRVQLRRAALNYAGHGWDVLPGAYLSRDRFRCGPDCRTVSCHPATMDGIHLASHEPDVVAGWWAGRPYSVLLATGVAFDVLEILGCTTMSEMALQTRLAFHAPAAVTPGGRLMILVRPGATLRPELATRPDTVLHGPQSWIPAPSTRTPSGPVRWLVDPVTVGWRLPDPQPIQATLLALLPRRPGR
jgi:hypothetical protein